MTPLDILHNEIDELEEMRGRATDAVRNILEDRLTEALDKARVDGGINVPMAMGMLADWVEDALTDITTDAFHMGVRFGEGRE
jgi:hypothetical protein